MMQIAELSVWGVLLVLLLLAVSVGLLWVADRRMLHSLFRLPFPLSVRFPAYRELVLVAVPVLLGSVVGGSCLSLVFTWRQFWPLAGLMLVFLLMSVPRAFRAYQRSLVHTDSHRRYLLANGATHLESLMPSVRRAFRAALLPLSLHRTSPMLFVLPFLFFTLLADGFSLGAALVCIVLSWLTALAVAVLAVVLSLWLSDRWPSRSATVASGRL